MLVPTVEVFIVTGFHVPTNPLVEVAGSAGAVLFWQSGPICVKVGVTAGLTVIVIVVVVAHCPAVGVNV